MTKKEAHLHNGDMMRNGDGYVLWCWLRNRYADDVLRLVEWYHPLMCTISTVTRETIGGRTWSPYAMSATADIQR